MFPYWALFGTAALAALVNNRGVARDRLHPTLIGLALLIVGMIGLRFEVGADWANYLTIYNRVGHMSFARAAEIGDIAFQTLNWLGQEWDLRIWFVNLGCAACFGYGLYRFSLIFDNPYLVLAIAIPYLVIAVAMGYTRQGAALGFVLAALADYIRRENILRFTVLVFMGSLFHNSAVVVFPLVALTSPRSRVINLLVVTAAIFLGYQAFATPGLEKIRDVYLNPAYASQGALVRVLMDFTAAVLFLLFKPYFRASDTELKIWRNFSIAAVAALASLLLVSSSAVVDRLALYLLPLQLAVFARAASIGGRNLSSVIAVLALFAAVLFTWLNFAANSWLWVPYGAYFFTE